MPYKGKEVLVFDWDLAGTYAVVYSDSLNVDVAFVRIEITEGTKLKYFERPVKYVDSLFATQQYGSSIDSVWIMPKEREVAFSALGETYRLPFSDSISSREEKLDFQIDLKEGWAFSPMGDTLQSRVLTDGNKFFVNQIDHKGKSRLNVIELGDNKIKIKVFSLGLEPNSLSDHIIAKYQLDTIKEERDGGKFYIKHYHASFDDPRFYAFIEEDEFRSITLYKINSPTPNLLWLLLIIPIIIVPFVIMIRRY
jgi:hypothetical protein